MDYLTRHAQQQPDQPAAIEGARRLTFRELEERSNRLANALLDLGVQSLERCTTVGYNALEHLVINAALRKLVAVALPMNYRLREDEITAQLDHSQSSVVFCGPEHVERVATAAARAVSLRQRVAWGSDDPRATLPAGWLHLDELIAAGSPEAPATTAGLTGPSMSYTAGTTGSPKGAYRASGTAPEVIQSYMRWFDLRAGDVHLVAGPLYHSAPSAFAAFTTILGGTNVLLRRFDAEAALVAIEEHRVSTTFMAPILLQRLVQLPDEVKRRHDLSSMRTLIVAAAPCPFEVKRAVMAMFGEVLYEFYGSSEVGCNTVMGPAEQLRKPGSCGRPCDGVEILVIGEDGAELLPGETGELFIKGSQVITEYWRNPEATAAARRGEHFSVGDVGYFDSDGYLYIVDRKRDMVISGGVNICTTEVENVLHGHPDVWDAAVIGVPDPQWGESVHAIIQLRPGSATTADDLLAWSRERLADYKCARSIEIRTELPRDEAGKIRKRDLREPFWQGHERRV